MEVDAPNDETKVFSGEACGKAILFGEHSVVYARPAIAIPVKCVKAQAFVYTETDDPGVLYARDIDRRVEFSDTENRSALARLLRKIVALFELEDFQWKVEVTSTIPIGSGMGSSAAVAAAIIKAMASALGRNLTPRELSSLVYETEMLYHGSPSGIDNTVITMEKPVWFIQGEPPEVLRVGRPFTIVLGNSGRPSRTKDVVNMVRYRWKSEPEKFETLFDEIAAVVRRGRKAVETGNISEIGALMNKNHELLKAMGVSSNHLDRLVNAARNAGAIGAKLTGAGKGGVIIALAMPDKVKNVRDALRRAGAKEIFETTIEANR